MLFLFHSLFLFPLPACGLFFNFHFIKLLYWIIFFFTTFKKYFPTVIPLAMCVCVCAQSCPTLCDPMDCAHQAPLCMEFSQQEYWGGLPFPLPGNLSYPGIKFASSVSPALTGRFFNTEPPGELHHWQYTSLTAIYLHAILYLSMCRFKKLTAVYFHFCSLSLWAIVDIILFYIFYKHRVNLYYFYFIQFSFNAIKNEKNVLCLLSS